MYNFHVRTMYHRYNLRWYDKHPLALARRIRPRSVARGSDKRPHPACGGGSTLGARDADDAVRAAAARRRPARPAHTTDRETTTPGREGRERTAAGSRPAFTPRSLTDVCSRYVADASVSRDHTCMCVACHQLLAAIVTAAVMIV